MEIFFIYVFMGSLAAYALYLIFRGRDRAIADPTLGFLNLGDALFASLIAADRAALSPLFSKLETGTGYQIPKCDVLFVYAEIASDGLLGLGKELTLRHLAERAGASIAVLASNNPAEHGIVASKLSGPKRANLVWTLNRRGDAFPRFFKELFTRMKDGKSMPLAWVAIAPQYQSEAHRDLPETICQMEAGQVRFR
ncbi:MAG TPA: hypothetical protein VF977_03040 [Candidatus Binatia bacterium]